MEEETDQYAVLVAWMSVPDGTRKPWWRFKKRQSVVNPRNRLVCFVLAPGQEASPEYPAVGNLLGMGFVGYYSKERALHLQKFFTIGGFNLLPGHWDSLEAIKHYVESLELW